MWIYGPNYTVHAVRYNPAKASEQFASYYGHDDKVARKGMPQILLRAFTKADLENFIDNRMAAKPIVKEGTADYQYRMLLKPEEFIYLFSKHIHAMAYDTLKQEVADREGRNSDRYDMLVDVHAVTKNRFDERLRPDS
jgi:hypothetical protein